MKTNKEIVTALMDYFRRHSDFETLARAMANQMLDLHRMMIFTQLPDQEAECLQARMKKNHETFLDFVRNGNKEKFNLRIIESAQELE